MPFLPIPTPPTKMAGAALRWPHRQRSHTVARWTKEGEREWGKNTQIRVSRYRFFILPFLSNKHHIPLPLNDCYILLRTSSMHSTISIVVLLALGWIYRRATRNKMPRSLLRKMCIHEQIHGRCDNAYLNSPEYALATLTLYIDASSANGVIGVGAGAWPMAGSWLYARKESVDKVSK